MTPNVTILAAECKGIAKVGGLADVVADLSAALAESGVPVRIIMPAYASAHLEGERLEELSVPFAGQEIRAGVVRTTVRRVPAGEGTVPVYGIVQGEFFGGENASIYVDSASRGRGPFEDDAARFAFFCAAGAELVCREPAFHETTVFHCHDWHTGTFLALARLADLGRFPVNAGFLFTVHNLDYQGVRPFRSWPGAGPLASFQSWFPRLADALAEADRLDPLLDPRHRDCYNPMRAAILLADRVNTVSPTYAAEITRQDAPATNFVGGRGLEKDLAQLAAQGRLTGILNGIRYAEVSPAGLNPPFDVGMNGWWKTKAFHKKKLYSSLGMQDVFTAAPLAVMVTRLAAQKTSLLLEKGPSGQTVLHDLCALPLHLLILGTGELQDAVVTAAQSVPGRNCHVIPAFDAALASQLYAAGDLFLMPSDFEPCGLSQMIAMRNGTLPVATRVGGLADTIRAGEDGFLFTGSTRAQAATRFVETVRDALSIMQKEPERWRRMQETAMQRRFEWTASAASYLELYEKAAAGPRPMRGRGT